MERPPPRPRPVPAGGTGGRALTEGPPPAAPRFAVLGPLLVRAADGSQVPVRQRLWRVALGTLLACSPGPCPREVLAAALWPEGFPARSGGALRAVMHGVREVPGVGGGALRPVPGGWLLDVPAADVDARLLRDLAARARRAWYGGDAAAALGLLGRALALWRAPGLDAIPAVPALAGFRGLLGREHQDVQELRAEALLAAGRPAEAAVLLGAITAADPARERAWAQLVRACAQAGDPDAARQCLARARTAVARATGAPAGPELPYVARGAGLAGPAPA